MSDGFLHDHSNNDNSKNSKNNNKLPGVFIAVLGVVVTAISIFITNQYFVAVIVVFVSLIVLALGNRLQNVRSILPSILAANPINGIAILPGNLVFAVMSVIFDFKSVTRLPRWVFVMTAMAFMSFVFSSIHWISNFKPQLGYMVQYLLGPLLLIPLVYVRLAENVSYTVKLKWLVLYLIIPSTVLFYVAYLIGAPVSTLKDEDLIMNIRYYQLGNTLFDFTRTHIGFILASLLCASTPIIILKIKGLYRLLATICFILNFILLLITGSVGSFLAFLCGFIVIFLIISRRLLIRSVIAFTFILSLLAIVWASSSPDIKQYVETRYEERFVKKGVNVEDRSILWGHAFNYMLKHPEGVGWSILVGDTIKHNTHNDYFLYAISYGIIAGMVYVYTLLRLAIQFFIRSIDEKLDLHRQAISLAGLGVAIVVIVNSLGDHLVANRWYFYVVWSILWFSYFGSQSLSTNSVASKD
ncbi:MAG: O-antigen ligase family protein [Chlorobium sp.]|nr:O-antigen ligase family protein [Chlorobium sp.]